MSDLTRLSPYRAPWSEVGAYDRESKTFRMERIPTPPEARREVRDGRNSPDDFARRTTTIEWAMRAACPSCLKPVTFVWAEHITDQYREGIDRALMHEASRRFTAEREVARLTAIVKKLARLKRRSRR